MRTYRIRSKLRLSLFIAFVLLLILTLAAPRWLRGNAMEPEVFRTVYVDEGDTLWSVARQTLPRGRDIRDYILEIQRVNGLESAYIYQGQTLEVPLYGGHAEAEGDRLRILRLTHP